MTWDRWRKLFIWSALVATVLAALLLDDADESYEDTVVQPVLSTRSVSNRRAVEQPRSILPIEQLGKRTFSAQADNIFPVTSWEPERTASRPIPQTFLPHEPINVPPPAPEPPPLPFKYLGKVQANGKISVFLTWDEESHVVGVGERIKRQYRVERIRDEAVELTFLPLGIRQTLFINEPNPNKL